MHVLTYFTDGLLRQTLSNSQENPTRLIKDITRASLRWSVEKSSEQREEEQVERVNSSRVQSIRTRGGGKCLRQPCQTNLSEKTHQVCTQFGESFDCFLCNMKHRERKWRVPVRSF